MMETNIEIKVKEEFPAGINVVKDIEGDNDDRPNDTYHMVSPKKLLPL